MEEAVTAVPEEIPKPDPLPNNPGMQEPDPPLPPPLPKPEQVKPEPEPEPAPPSSHSHGGGTKRKLVSLGDFRNTNYYKIRTIIRDLRPLFLQVIHAPDFRHNKVVGDIRKQMKTMIELARELRYAEYNTRLQTLAKEQPSGGAAKEEKPQLVESQVPQTRLEKIPPEEGSQGTYVVGGSPVGWNFLVYLGGNPVYYGETKASFRARQAAKAAQPSG
ncbi:uncharacterized protein M6B38_378380 [Iris pallida]|uniref:Uncharacterized protein n=1 Tax=Iris pallida TaxID=29817 RepID=A0AAX6G9K8_IRIPA|nr:uncharacterized protein M6B38_378380 [Iris pallida]